MEGANMLARTLTGIGVLFLLAFGLILLSCGSTTDTPVPQSQSSAIFTPGPGSTSNPLGPTVPIPTLSSSVSQSSSTAISSTLAFSVTKPTQHPNSNAITLTLTLTLPGSATPTPNPIVDTAHSWMKALGDKSEIVGTSVAATANGTYLVAGYLTGEHADVFVLNVDESGQVLWTRKLDSTRKRNSAGYQRYRGDEMGAVQYFWTDLKATKDGGSVIAVDAALIRLDPQGKPIWSKQYSPICKYPHDLLLSSVVDLDDGDIVACGSYLIGPSVKETLGDDLIVMRVNRDGDLKWALEYPEFRGAKHPILQMSGDGNLILGSRAEAQGSHMHAGVAKLDLNGKVLWAKSLIPGRLSNEPRGGDPEQSHYLLSRFQGMNVASNHQNMFSQGFS
jgi:hypothetical protein